MSERQMMNKTFKSDQITLSSVGLTGLYEDLLLSIKDVLNQLLGEGRVLVL